MDHLSHISAGSPSSSTSSSDPTSHHHHRNNGNNGHLTLQNSNNSTTTSDPMHSWWESISKARSRIHLLTTLLSNSSLSSSLSSLADSDRPARSLLSSFPAYSALSASLSSPTSGSGSDLICNWLYDTFLSADPDLRLVVLSFIPILSGQYLSRIHSTSSPTPSLAGFEAVLLSLYTAETKSRAGKPVIISIPDLSQPSLYHTPRNTTISSNKSNPNPSSISARNNQSRPSVGVLSPPLEPQVAVKSTKRAAIVGVAFDCYYKQISQMPSWSKLDFCQFAADWAGQDCTCKSEFDQTNSETEITNFEDGIRNLEIEDVVEEGENLGVNGNELNLVKRGTRIPLPWELLQPMLRILGHCLLAPLNTDDVKAAASVAVRCLYARASHDLVPQAILATRSLIQLDNRAREAAQVVVASNVASNANTPSKAKKPEILLVSK
ncbi:hypothetical protein LguiB_006852 [Lonicera macranthoides]